MRLLRENPDGVDVVVYASNVDPDAVALRAADVAAVEPQHVSDPEYARFALEFCRRHAIDVLIAPRRLTALAGRIGEFAAVGTTLTCSPLASIRALTNKARTYELATAAGVPVPPWRVASDSVSLRAAVAELSADPLCIKPSGEYSAFGFRILDDRPLSVAGLRSAPRPVASVDAVANALDRAAAEGEKVPELLVMPFLDEPEVSIDCLSTRAGDLIVGIARAKQGRYRMLLDDPTLVDIAARLVAHFELAYLTNVQLRYYRGEPVLLEVNARPSAGLFQTAYAGVNLPWAAVRMALGSDAGLVGKPRLGVRLAVSEAVMEVPLAAAPDWATADTLIAS
ncbi:ATP-grasp domain-containing protein [Nocardia camponoti]|uniref:ATP-grasp domain-containing protein n=1 Tax=Nocardia camponoti TaxID=1616106 RepID=A0A917QGI8_9NOCA|nr:ATP-grasp domain-containing protein [Nocardia camponoti]GGK49667.1 hypothetical protein GCM10011591_21420 [Nocardia camponoti]